MDKVERKKLNLKAIKRYDSAIVNILDQSPHSVLYSFSQEKREWVKKSIEGVLFLVQRNAPPYFAVYIMNRLAMENYTLYLTDFEDMELQQNFIMYSTKGGERYAFWLYEEKDRTRLLNKITRLHDGIQKELSAKTQTTQNNTQSTSQPTSQPSTQSDQQTSGSGTASVDLLSMLKNATPRHYPPNEYGPEQIEQKHQQQHPFHHPSPAMLPPFQDALMNQWVPPPPPPTSVPDIHTPEFTLPNAELLMPQSHHHPSSSEQPNGNRLLELLQKSVINNDSQQQQQQQHIPSPGPPPHPVQSVPPPPLPEWNNGNKLLELLKKASIDDQKNMQHMPSPPPPMHPVVNMLFGTPPQQHPHLPHPPPPLSSSSSTPNTMVAPPPPHPLFGKELTKPYTPMVMGENNNINDNNNNNTSRNANQSQGRNSALLLQALQGGMLNAPSSTVNNNINGSVNSDDGNNNNSNSLNVNGINGQHEFSTTSSVVTLHGSPGPTLPSSSRSSFSNVTPLMPQQTLSLAQQEINKRLSGNQQHQQHQQQQQRFLSKPEFIQQFLNIVQNDPTFFDTLYEDYKTQKTNGIANN